MIGEPHDIACARIAAHAIERGEKNPFRMPRTPMAEELVAAMQRPPVKWHRAKWHVCCWMWKLALVVPAIHIVLHLMGVPHPEVLSFIP